jgi:rhodanese-related sulfurtransferase
MAFQCLTFACKFTLSFSINLLNCITAIKFIRKISIMWKSILSQSLIIVAVAAVLGLTANALNPRGVALTLARPAGEAVADSLLAPGTTSDRPLLINRRQLTSLIKAGNTVLIDARTPEEFAAGHLPGAVNISFELLGEFVERMDALPRQAWLVCYCDGPPCDKGEMLARELFAKGFTGAAFYNDGLDDWKAAGGEVAR